jgi:hypothetical protein
MVYLLNGSCAVLAARVYNDIISNLPKDRLYIDYFYIIGAILNNSCILSSDLPAKMIIDLHSIFKLDDDIWLFIK